MSSNAQRSLDNSELPSPAVGGDIDEFLNDAPASPEPKRQRTGSPVPFAALEQLEGVSTDATTPQADGADAATTKGAGGVAKPGEAEGAAVTTEVQANMPARVLESVPAKEGAEGAAAPAADAPSAARNDGESVEAPAAAEVAAEVGAEGEAPQTQVQNLVEGSAPLTLAAPAPTDASGVAMTAEDSAARILSGAAATGLATAGLPEANPVSTGPRDQNSENQNSEPLPPADAAAMLLEAAALTTAASSAASLSTNALQADPPAATSPASAQDLPRQSDQNLPQNLAAGDGTTTESSLAAAAQAGLDSQETPAGVSGPPATDSGSVLEPGQLPEINQANQNQNSPQTPQTWRQAMARRLRAHPD